MRKVATILPDVWIIEPKVYGDRRGYFVETYNQKAFESLDIHNVFVQDNLSFTQKKHTLRGIHFQQDPATQCKLVRAHRGVVVDLAVDLRRGSPTYLQWVLVELSSDNKRMLYIPRGFGHAFLTVSDDVEFCYKADNFYSPQHDRTIRYDDPQIKIDWGFSTPPILSQKDLDAPLLKDSDCNFIFEEQGATS
jgi:dTDP-4-dehydrorhamnose 3,5-epimerase